MSKPTQKMIDFAVKIADRLDIPEPNMNSFDDVAEFIDEFKQDYFESINDKDRI